jgi:beta-N-acetylhexosaminidase
MRGKGSIARRLIAPAVGLIAALFICGPSTLVTRAAGVVGLSVQQSAGQRVIYGYPGLNPPAGLLQRISAGQAAGVIFFSDNISSTSQIRSVIQQLDQANQQSPVKAPLLLMVDQEGGQVRRLPGEPVLSEKQVGQSADPASAATQAGTGAGQNLRSVGMDVNLAPVLDVYRQPGDLMDQYQRSYSSDPNQVASLGKAFISAQQQTTVAATAKHFPGLGAAAASQNTDTKPVTLNLAPSTLRTVDELPYQAAIGAGVKLVMVSWATYPALDSSRPAGLSSTVIQQELRNRLGFRGVTITDSLDAGAVTGYGSPAQRAVLAAQAGADLMVYSARDAGEGQSVADGLAAALQSGQLDQAGFDAAVQRITAVRTSLG